MKKEKYNFMLLSALTGFLIFAGAENQKAQTNKELIKFSHSFHLEMAECTDCHTAVEKSESLSDELTPTMDNCADCHDVEDEDNCSLCHYEDVFEPLVQKKSEVMFNHKLHLENGSKCVDCHKGLLNVDYVFESSAGYPQMTACITCHSETGSAPSECENCHISTANLMPENHSTPDFAKRHKVIAQMQPEECASCHDESFCESCHAATTGLKVGNTPDDFYTPYSPHKLIDNKNMQQIELVHSLDYRFTHGIDAKGNAKECRTCHETESFCVECHESDGGDFALGGIQPMSHTSPNFTTIGVGSGGGLHAELARRDIESCSACHDVEGSDPACILCHVDPDGIKGTNPKTHPASFMSDSEGDWHSDFNSVCFTCHTDANANPNGTKGIGFCGYCHEQ